LSVVHRNPNWRGQHKMKKTLLKSTFAGLLACTAWAPALFAEEPLSPAPQSINTDVFWKNATVYFMLTDRFANGDPSNDTAYGRGQDTGVLRSFVGGDIKGITQKIEEGYFTKLGVDVLWTTPLLEQVQGPWQDDFGKTYAYHGYWPRDWTNVDQAYGSEADMAEMIAAAHKKGIRVLADVILNHTGPVTVKDARWPNEWVREGNVCNWQDYANNVTCRLADSLEDILTETEAPVELPPFLLKKWEAEGRLDRELAELDAFFARTGYERAPKYYIIKWLTDWVRDYGIDGFRVDTAKHIEAEIWQELKKESVLALNEWRAANPDRKLDDKPFFMMGEVYHWGALGFNATVDGGRAYDYGDQQVDFFNYGFDSLINMGFPTHADAPYEQIFSQYSTALNGGELDGIGMLNYVSSHDDMGPYDQDRASPYATANRLMLAPGAVQIYYGDELARSLRIKGTIGDATLRSAIDWSQLENKDTQALLEHWQKLGQFRQAHPAVGAGIHQQLNGEGYVFSRKLDTEGITDRVLVGLEQAPGIKTFTVSGLFEDNTELKDYYSGKTVLVKNGTVTLETNHNVVLLGASR